MMNKAHFAAGPAGPAEIEDQLLDHVIGGGRSQCEGDDGTGTGDSKPSGSTITFVGGWGSSMYQY